MPQRALKVARPCPHLSPAHTGNPRRAGPGIAPSVAPGARPPRGRTLRPHTEWPAPRGRAESGGGAREPPESRRHRAGAAGAPPLHERPRVDRRRRGAMSSGRAVSGQRQGTISGLGDDHAFRVVVEAETTATTGPARARIRPSTRSSPGTAPPDPTGSGAADRAPTATHVSCAAVGPWSSVLSLSDIAFTAKFESVTGRLRPRQEGPRPLLPRQEAPRQGAPWQETLSEGNGSCGTRRNARRRESDSGRKKGFPAGNGRPAERARGIKMVGKMVGESHGL